MFLVYVGNILSHVAAGVSSPCLDRNTKAHSSRADVQHTLWRWSFGVVVVVRVRCVLALDRVFVVVVVFGVVVVVLVGGSRSGRSVVCQVRVRSRRFEW